MRRTKYILPLVLLVACLHVAGAQDTLLLFHPTAENLQFIESLDQKELLDLEGYHVLGIYHAWEEYDYRESMEMFRELPGGKYSLQAIPDTLEPSVVYGRNGSSDEFRRLFRRSHGAIFPGGPDIPPGLYHETTHLLTNVTDPFRHYLEVSFLFHLLGGNQDPHWIPFLEEDPEYLVIGICLGMQTMNVATGGSLVQDIPTELYHTWSAEQLLAMPPDQVHRNYADMVSAGCEKPTSYHFHRIRLIDDNSFLVQALHYGGNREPRVLSSHHQAVEIPGPGWKVSATSMDGRIIEAMEHERYPHVFGVQFHPEKPGLFNPDIVHPESCGKQISFREEILGTDSYLFHTSFWEYAGQILQEGRDGAIRSQ